MVEKYKNILLYYNMGSTQSTNNQVSNTNIITNDTLKMVNENLNNFTANTVISQASNCSAGLNQNQTFNMSGTKIAKDLNIGSIDQNQKASLTFDCVQLSNFQGEIANGILDRLTSELKSNYGAEALGKMAAEAAAKSKSGFASTAGDTTTTNNTAFNFNSITNIDKDIKNVMENNITNNLNLNSLQECISMVSSSQNIDLSDMDIGKSAIIGSVSQDQAADTMSKCVQQQGVVNSVTNNIAKDLGMEISNASTVKSSVEMKSTGNTESENSGVFESLGGAISGILKSVGDVLNGLLGGLLKGPMIIVAAIVLIICMCLCCCLSCCAIMMMGGGKGGNTSSSTSGSSVGLEEIQDGGFYRQIFF
jgi:hypothetical protein